MRHGSRIADFKACKQPRRKPACAHAQSDQRICYSPSGKTLFVNMLHTNLAYVAEKAVLRLWNLLFSRRGPYDSFEALLGKLCITKPHIWIKLFYYGDTDQQNEQCLNIFVSSWDFDICRISNQIIFRRACVTAQSRQSIRCTMLNNMSRDMVFTKMWYVRPAKAKTSLRIRAVWSEPL